MDRKFWNNKRIFVTGHTGFKGAWLTLNLLSCGAKICGYSLKPPTAPNLFSLLNIENSIKHIEADIRDFSRLEKEIKNFKPDFVINLAAQSLVGFSYKDPYETYTTNFVGTLNILEVLRKVNTNVVFLNITTDKVYENKESIVGYKEEDRLGGFDPYSNSKACSEMLTKSYTDSFFKSALGIKSATLRSGNVIGGGDWSNERLIPDIIRSIQNNSELKLRNIEATRPWQHVLDSLNGYMVLGENIFNSENNKQGSWNFGPSDDNEGSVIDIVNYFQNKYSNFNLKFSAIDQEKYHETSKLKLDSSKARKKLKWKSILSFTDALDFTFDWYINFIEKDINVQDFTLKQLSDFYRLLDL